MSDFEFAKVLGSGGTATVIRAEPIPGSNASLAIPAKEVALKAVTRKGLNRRGQHYLHREIAIHRNVQQHANIASLYEVFEDSEGIYLAMEYLRGADLYTVLKKERRGLSERIALCIISQILDALSYMHALGYAHRDIKPENLMFQDKPNFHEGKVGMIKLIDFGLACARDPNARCEERTSSEKCGTVRYAAPEIVTEASYVPELCDIWSVGIVMYSIIAHRNPYTGKTEKEVLQQILNTNLTFDTPEWDRVSEDSKRLIRAMLSRKACDRPHAAEALKEVRRILQQLSPSTSSSSCVSTDSTGHGHGRRRPGDDVSGFSSHVTPERQGSRNPSRGGEANGGGNFLDGLIKAFFSRGSSAERSGSEGS